MSEIILPKGAIDLDDTVLDTAPILANEIDQISEVTYPWETLMGGRISKEHDPYLYFLRQKLLQSPDHLSKISLLPFAETALYLLHQKTQTLHLLTGKSEKLYLDVIRKLSEEQVLHYFGQIKLRPEYYEDHEEFKIREIQKEGYNFIADNDGKICQKASELEVFAALMHQEYENTEIKEGPFLKRYQNGLIGFALDWAKHGTLESLIEEHQKKIDNSKTYATV